MSRGRVSGPDPTLQAFAPGKVILLGEHAVVYGHPAVAVPLTRGVTAHARRSSKPRLLVPPSVQGAARVALKAAFARALEVSGAPALEVALESDLPPSMGLGSSAAVSVACARVLLASQRRAPASAAVLTLALEMEKEFHGTPSGLDHTVSALDAPVLYRRNPAGGAVRVQRLAVQRPLSLLVVLVGTRSPTRKTVTALRERQARWPDRYARLFQAIGATAREGAEALEAGDLAGLGDAMNVNQGLLSAAGLSSLALDQVVYKLRALGAHGAKLTGAGGEGGAVVGLFSKAEAALCTLRRARVACFVSQVAVSRSP